MSAVEYRFSSPRGPGNQYDSDKNHSLGGFMASNEIKDGYTLFDNIANRQSVLYVDYRCIFIYNSSDLDIQDVVVSVQPDQAPGGTSVLLGIDPNLVSPADSVSKQAETVLGKTVAPLNVTFALTAEIGTIPSGYCCAFWYQRIADHAAPITYDDVKVRTVGNILN